MVFLRSLPFAFLFFVSFVFAADGDGLVSSLDLPAAVAEVTIFGGSFRLGLQTIVDFFLYFLGLIAVIMIIYAGFLYITSGSTGGADKAKKILMYVAMGIAVILVSYALVYTLLGAGQESAVRAQ